MELFAIRYLHGGRDFYPAWLSPQDGTGRTFTIRVGKERVRKLMQRHGIKARGKKKFVVTTDSKHDLPIAPNLLQRNFSPQAPNQV